MGQGLTGGEFVLGFWLINYFMSEVVRPDPELTLELMQEVMGFADSKVYRVDQNKACEEARRLGVRPDRIGESALAVRMAVKSQYFLSHSIVGDESNMLQWDVHDLLDDDRPFEVKVSFIAGIGGGQLETGFVSVLLTPSRFDIEDERDEPGSIPSEKLCGIIAEESFVLDQGCSGKPTMINVGAWDAERDEFVWEGARRGEMVEGESEGELVIYQGAVRLILDELRRNECPRIEDQWKRLQNISGQLKIGEK